MSIITLTPNEDVGQANPDPLHLMRPGLLQLSALPPLALYIHLPWCIKKCPYCDFNSHESKDIPQQAYVDALLDDLAQDLPLIWGRRIESIFIGGGKAHGPRVRDFNPSLNKKIRALGLKMALSSKAKAGSLIVLEDLDVKDGKTKVLVESRAKLGFGKTTLVIDGEGVNDNFRKASANIVGVNVLPAVGANVYDILKHETLVLTRAAVEKLEARFNG